MCGGGIWGGEYAGVEVVVDLGEEAFEGGEAAAESTGGEIEVELGAGQGAGFGFENVAREIFFVLHL